MTTFRNEPTISPSPRAGRRPPPRRRVGGHVRGRLSRSRRAPPQLAEGGSCLGEPCPDGGRLDDGRAFRGRGLAQGLLELGDLSTCHLAAQLRPHGREPRRQRVGGGVDDGAGSRTLAGSEVASGGGTGWDSRSGFGAGSGPTPPQGPAPVRAGPGSVMGTGCARTIAQLVVSTWTGSWRFRAYVLLPARRSPLLAFLGAFLAAQLLGLASHVPGGVGVFEGLMVLLLKPYLSSGELLPPLVVYRAVYYLLPLAWRSSAWSPTRLCSAASRPRASALPFGGLTEQLTPHCWRCSRSSPAWCCSSRARRRPRRGASRCSTRVPLGVIEASHFLGQRRRRRAAAAVAGARAAARCRVLPDGRRHRRGIVGVAAQGVRLRRGDAPGAACSWCCGARGRRSIGAPRSSTRASRPAGSSRSPARSARRSGSGSSPSSTSSTRTSSGGSSSCTAKRRDSCAPRSARRSSCCCSRVARLIAPRAARGRSSRPTRISTPRAPSSPQPAHRRPNLVYLRDKALLFDDERDAVS